ncbi:YciI family protein [Tellurirhabdus bombi]|uniref:YciI family protein n=1 Tax=Tellurirhabdus bombi TaxID=2907205 RepID=UPI001F434E19|nr:YciI family protein [Tellurirhabdus bombi]
MQYVVHAYDFTDEQAYDRRLAARPAHFERARQLKADGHFILGGALLDETGKMIGSMMLVEFDSEENLNNWLQSDPYVVGKVWDRIDVKPFRKADV